MATTLTLAQLEQRLVDSLRKDRGKKSRLSPRLEADGSVTTIVSVSNRSVGLAIAIEHRTGERDAMERLSERV